jgi:hypothetical protein
MITNEERPNSVDNAAIDRLIDGELSDIERRELLLQLENDPEGWRRCALAFLEDQAWRQALAGVVPAVPRSKPVEPVPPVPRRGKDWLRRVSIAASLMASTFAAGYAAGGIAKPGPGLEIAKSKVQQAPVEKAANPEPAQEQIREVGKIDLVDGSNGEAPIQSLPILSGPGLDDRWLQDQPSTVPDYLRARWEREGYQVEERRRVVSVILKDGRKVSIPVDEVALDYVGRNPL